MRKTSFAGTFYNTVALNHGPRFWKSLPDPTRWAPKLFLSTSPPWRPGWTKRLELTTFPSAGQRIENSLLCLHSRNVNALWTAMLHWSWTLSSINEERIKFFDCQTSIQLAHLANQSWSSLWIHLLHIWHKHSPTTKCTNSRWRLSQHTQNRQTGKRYRRTNGDNLVRHSDNYFSP